MKNLLELALEAYGGLARWSQLKAQRLISQ